jgi:acetyl esterase/lipase
MTHKLFPDSTKENRMLKLWDDEIPFYNPQFEQEPPRLEPYLLEGKSPRACVIVFPGGGYSGLAPHEAEPIARWLNAAGISAFVLSYRVFPYRFPAPLLDAQRAIRTVRHHAPALGIDPQRIGILGFSAGGHLASSAATHYDPGNPAAADPVERESSRPNAQILCYPVISFGQYRHDGSMRALLGDKPLPELVMRFSNETQVTPDTPPAFLFHTANDEAVPVENSLLYASALSRCKVPFDLHIYAEGPHGVGLAQENPILSQWTNQCISWLGKIGFLWN